MSRKILEYVGDADPIEYGGGVIFKENGNPWLEHTLYSLDDFEALKRAYSDDESETTLQIISIPLYTNEAAFWHFFNWIGIKSLNIQASAGKKSEQILY